VSRALGGRLPTATLLPDRASAETDPRRMSSAGAGAASPAVVLNESFRAWEVLNDSFKTFAQATTPVDRRIHEPSTLTASRSGKPLYDKLGFTTLGDANWWR